jgi:hypothetical protein
MTPKRSAKNLIYKRLFPLGIRMPRRELLTISMIALGLA